MILGILIYRSLLKCINKKQKQLFLCICGQPANILEIKKIAKKYNLYVIRSAPAIGSKINNINCGSWRLFSIWLSRR